MYECDECGAGLPSTHSSTCTRRPGYPHELVDAQAVARAAGRVLVNGMGHELLATATDISIPRRVNSKAVYRALLLAMAEELKVMEKRIA